MSRRSAATSKRSKSENLPLTRTRIESPRRLAQAAPWEGDEAVLVRSHSYLFLSTFLGLGVLAVAACSSDEESRPNPGIDAGDTNTKPDAGKTGNGGDDDDDDTEAGKPDPKDAGADAARPAPVFLDATAYSDLIELDAKFTFGVTQKHVADKNIAGSRWGHHGGPLVTANVFGGGDLATVAWSIGATPTADASKKVTTVKVAADLPDAFSYADGLTDLPFGSFALLGYAEFDSPFPGEALVYSNTYDSVKTRAKVNGFYSGVGLATGGAQYVIYAGLSPMTAAATDTDDNGLYVAPICSGVLAGPAPCPASWKLFSWMGNSGPVVTDAHGHVFVGASLSGGTTSDAVYAIVPSQIKSGMEATKITLAEVDSGGTSTLAAVAPDGKSPGWVVGKGFTAADPLYAASFTESGDSLTKGDVVKTAISGADGVTAISAFTDDEGDLWLAVTKGDTGTYLELRPKTP